MSIYSAVFTGVAVSAAQDVFEITAPANSWVRIHEVVIGQYSDFGDAQAEILSIQFIRGYTVTGSGGTTPTINPRSPATGALASTSVVKVNNTTVANTGTAATLRADTWNVQTPYLYMPPAGPDPAETDTAILIGASQRLVVRITAPADALTVNGTIIFEEIGKNPA